MNIIYRIVKILKKIFFYNKNLFILKTQVKTYAEVFLNHMACNEVEIRQDQFFSKILGTSRIDSYTGFDIFFAAGAEFRVMYQYNIGSLSEKL